MLILALDIATVTGFAWHEDTKPVSAIEAGAIRLKAKTDEEKALELGRELVMLFRDRRPEFVAIETPLKNVKRFEKRTQSLIGEDIEASMNPAAIIVPNQLCGAAMAVVGIFNIPHVLISSATWRKQFLGFGRKPGWQRKDWKKATRDQCDRELIKVTNDDMADAVGIAIAAKATDEFRMLRHRKEAA